MEHSADNKKPSLFFGIIIFLLASSLVASYCIFYLSKNYDFTFNDDCDPALRICHVSKEDGSTYRVFHILARDFDVCSAEGACTAQCENGSLTCAEAVCNPGGGDACSVPVEQKV